MLKDRFHYCMNLEVVEWELFGYKKCPRNASSFANPTYLKKRCKAFLHKLMIRIDDIVTNDETLRLLLTNDIDRLEKEIGRISGKNNNDIEIFAEFFKFIAHLLGWAHCDGKLYRTPIFFQTEEQREDDLNKSAQLKLARGLYEAYMRRKLIKQLRAENISYSAIALIMNLTASTVKSLENAQGIDELYQDAMSRNK